MVCILVRDFREVDVNKYKTKAFNDLRFRDGTDFKVDKENILYVMIPFDELGDYYRFSFEIRSNPEPDIMIKDKSIQNGSGFIFEWNYEDIEPDFDIVLEWMVVSNPFDIEKTPFAADDFSSFLGYTGTLPYATSTYPNDKWGNYSIHSAFDNDISTAWAENAESFGKNEQLYFLIKKKPGKIRIFPGYGKDDVFYINNRLKQVKFSLYEVSYTGSINTYTFIKSMLLDFKDEMRFQSFDLHDIKDLSKGYNGYMGIIEIISVYEGRDSDTCIAEIQCE